MPVPNVPKPLYRIDECPDVMADACVGDDQGNLIFLSIAGCGGLWATVGFGAWGNALMTRQYGISPVVAGSIIASFGIGAVIAKPTLGWISD